MTTVILIGAIIAYVALTCWQVWHMERKLDKAVDAWERARNDTPYCMFAGVRTADELPDSYEWN